MIARNLQGLLRRTAVSVAAFLVFSAVMPVHALTLSLPGGQSCPSAQITLGSSGELQIVCAADPSMESFTVTAATTSIPTLTGQVGTYFTIKRTSGTGGGSVQFTVRDTGGACLNGSYPQHFANADQYAYDAPLPPGGVPLTIQPPLGGGGTCTITLDTWTPDSGAPVALTVTPAVIQVGSGGQSNTSNNNNNNNNGCVAGATYVSPPVGKWGTFLAKSGVVTAIPLPAPEALYNGGKLAFFYIVETPTDPNGSIKYSISPCAGKITDNPPGTTSGCNATLGPSQFWGLTWAFPEAGYTSDQLNAAGSCLVDHQSQWFLNVQLNFTTPCSGTTSCGYSTQLYDAFPK